MKVRTAILTVLFLPLLAIASPSTKKGAEGSLDNAGMYRYEGCADASPIFGAMIGFGALARRRRRVA